MKKEQKRGGGESVDIADFIVILGLLLGLGRGTDAEEASREARQRREGGTSNRLHWWAASPPLVTESAYRNRVSMETSQARGRAFMSSH